MKENYITAVLEELRMGSDPERILRGLKTALQKRGHDRLYAAILRGVVRVLESDSTETTVVTVVDQAAFEKQKNVIMDTLASLGTNDQPKVVQDSTIVGGFIAEAANKRLDKSYKAKLVSLYRSLTT